MNNRSYSDQIPDAKQHRKDAAKSYKQNKIRKQEYINRTKDQYRESFLKVVAPYLENNNKYGFMIPMYKFKEIKSRFTYREAEYLIFLIACDEFKPKGYKVSRNIHDLTVRPNSTCNIM